MKLIELSQELTKLVEQAGQAVLRVDARHRFPAAGTTWSDNGLIVTAHHAVEREDHIRVGVGNGEEYTARLIGRDPTTDLAVLIIEDNDFHPQVLQLALTELQVGSLVLALGRPGERVQASLGMLEAAGGSWRTSAGGSVDSYLQSSIEMLPGFSGGPLVDMAGALVGINTSALQHNGSLTLPHSTVDRVVRSLAAHGRIRRAFLGVTSQPVRLGDDAANSAGQSSGLMVIATEGGGPAATAGILQGDILLSVGGTPTRRVEDLVAALTTDNPTAPISLKILRGGQIQEFQVSPREKE